MPEENLQPCAFHIVRYKPNVVRDEWVNIGVIVVIPGDAVKPSRLRQRWLEEPADLTRLRRLHPAVDEAVLLGLPTAFEQQFDGRGPDPEALLEKADGALWNNVQLAPRKGLLTPDPEAELDRLFRDQVEPLREARRGTAEIRTRADVRARAADFFRSAKILRFMQRGVRVEEYTAPGDPMRIDFAYRRNGTRGFVQSLALARDPGQAKLLAYTAGAIRKHVPQSEFLAVTEREPARGNPRDQFVMETLEKVSEISEGPGVRILPLSEVRKWAEDIAPLLRAEAS